MLTYSIGITLFKMEMGESHSTIYQMLTPVTSQRWWFMTCYVILYCLSPFINSLTASLSQRRFLTLLAVMAFFYLLSPTLLSHELTKDMHGKGLPNMITAYLIGRYMATYKLPDIVFNYAGRLWLLAVLLLMALTLWNGNKYCRDNNMLIVMGAISLFCWVEQHPFTSHTVNYLASYVFPLFLVNYAILNELSVQYKPLINDFAVWPPFLLTLLETVVIAFLIELVRRLLMDGSINWLCRKADSLTIHNQP